MTSTDNNTPSRLSDAALADLGLSAQPFEDDRKRDHMNDSNSQSIRSEIEQQLKHGDLLHLLIGPSGSGKSVLLSQLVRHNEDYLKPYIARGDGNFEARGFLAAVLGQFEENEAHSLEEHIERLIPHFESLNSDQTAPALIIDNAHQAPIEEIAELITAIPALTRDGKPLARLLLTGVAAFQDEIDAVGEQLDLPKYSVSSMPALTVDRTREYLSFRLNQAGFVGEFPFTDNAITRIQQNADGIPSAINQHAATYLNKVYTGTGVAAAGAAEGGLIGALGWPVIGLGAAALALIVWGLSMFGGGDSAPDQTLAGNDSEPTVTATALPAADNAGQQTDAAVVNAADDLLRPEHRDSDSPAQSIAEQTPPAGTIADGSDAQTATTLPAAEQGDAQAGDEQAGEVQTPQTDSDAAGQSATAEPSAPQVTESEPATPASEQIDAAADTTEATTESSDAAAETANATNDAPEPAGAETLVDRAEQDLAAAGDDQTGAQGEQSVVVPIPQQPADSTDAASVPVATDGSSDDGVAVDVTEPEPPRILRAVENERWVLFQPQTKFTLQLATSRERDYIMEFAQTLPLDGPLAVYPFIIKSNGRQVYGLLNGLFDTTDEALAAIAAMPPEVRKFKPWIRPIKQLQDEIKNGQ